MDVEQPTGACHYGQAQLDSLSAQCDELRKESAQNEDQMEIIPRSSMYGIFTYIYPTNDPVL